MSSPKEKHTSWFFGFVCFMLRFNNVLRPFLLPGTLGVVCLCASSRTTFALSTQMLRRYRCAATKTSSVQFANEALRSGIASCIARVDSHMLTYSIRHRGSLPLAVHVEMMSALTARPLRPPLSVRHASAVVGIALGSAPGSGQRHQTPEA
jgi:hypothetical protein